MPIEIRMPALSPTMEQGTLAKWLVKAGDAVKAGDLLAEIETDKATMEFEAIDDGIVAELLVAEGTDEVSVGTVIATLAAEGEAVSAAPAAHTPPAAETPPEPAAAAPAPAPASPPSAVAGPPPPARDADPSIDASPLARRIASQRWINLSAVTGSGPQGRIVKADVAPTSPAAAPVAPAAAPVTAPAPAPKSAAIPDIPHQAAKLTNMRKTIARRLTESKSQVPHIYLTVDVRLDALLALRADLNETLAARGVKLSVNDLMVKALALALIEVPACNVMFTPDQLVSFTRADVSVAVSTPTGLLTPVIKDATAKSLSRISTEVKDLAARARDGKLAPEDYTGGTASISNMGMYGIRQFAAIINPPQGMILAIGAGEMRPYVVDGAVALATVMSATGSFDHRAIDGADGAAFMQAFKALVEAPLRLAS